MRLVLYFVFLFGSVSISMAQRTMDLAAEIISPQSNTSVPYNEPIPFNIQVTNQGSEDFNETDSLYIYLVINGEPVTINSEDYTIRTGTSIAAGGGIHTLTMQFAFSMGTQGNDYEWCVSIIPVNAADPITEETIGDNNSCVNVSVTDSSAVGMDAIAMSTFTVSPNPAKNIVHLNFEPDDEVRLISIDGKQVLKTKLNGHSFDVSQVPNGVYLLSFDVERVPYSMRVVVSD